MGTERRGRSSLSGSCDEVREAISARFDGEHGPLSESILARHLGACQPCRAYEQGLWGLSREVGLRAPRAAPNGFARQLAGAARNLPSPGRASRLHGHLVDMNWMRVLGWAGAVAPAAVAIPALALGAYAHVDIVPSHVLTPCTAHLMEHLVHR